MKKQLFIVVIVESSFDPDALLFFFGLN